MADPFKLSLEQRMDLANDPRLQNPAVRTLIYQKLGPGADLRWLRDAINDPEAPPTLGDTVTSAVKTGAQAVADNPIKTGAIVGGIALPLITGGASVPAQIALAGLGGAGGAGYGGLISGLLANTPGVRYQPPDLMNPQNRTVKGALTRVGEEGVGQAVAAATGHAIGATQRGFGNLIQRYNLPGDLAREFPSLGQTLNEYWINPTSKVGLDWAKTLRSDAADKADDLVRGYAQQGGAPIVEADLWPRMRGAIGQAREEGKISRELGASSRGVIRKQVRDLMEAQPMGTFPLAPPPYPLNGASSNVIPGSPSTQPWWRGWTSNTIPGSPPGPGGGLGASGGGGAAGGGGGGGGGGIAPWMRGIFRRGGGGMPASAEAETLALPEAQAAQGAFQPTSPAIAPHAGEVVAPDAMGGITPGSPAFQPTSPTIQPRVASGPIPPTPPQLQPTGLAIAPSAGEVVTPGELQAGATVGALPGSGEVPAIRPRVAVPSSDPRLQPTGIVPSDRTLITPRVVNEGLPPGATGEFQPTGLAEAGPRMSVEGPSTGIARRVVDAEVVPEDLARRVVEGEVVPDVPDPTQLQPTGLATQGRVTAGPIPTPATVSNLPHGAVPNFGGGLGGLPPNAGALPPAGGGSAPRWTPATTRQERAIQPMDWADVIRRLQDRGQLALSNQQAQESGSNIVSRSYNDLANAVRQRANELLPGRAAANAQTQQMIGASRAAADMQNPVIDPTRVAKALAAGTGLATLTGYQTHDPVKTAIAGGLALPFAFPQMTARMAIGLYQAGRLPYAQLLQAVAPNVATPVAQQILSTMGIVPEEQP